MTILKTALISVALLAAACGGSSAGAGGSSGKAPSVDSLADKLGCSNLDETTTDRELFTSGQASCDALGDTVNIRTFDNDDARDNWLKTAREFGGRFVVLSGAVVYGEQGSTADEIKDKVGGDIQS